MTATDLPIGPAIDPTPAALPGPVTLAGRYGRLEKLGEAHAADLWAAVKGHERIWTYMPSYGPFGSAAEFFDWVAARAALTDPYTFAIIEASGRATGILTLTAIRPEHRVVEVAHVLYAPALQRTTLATEAQYLLAAYVFETLRYRRYEWKCDALNAASRRAALRYGFRFEGIFRQHMIAKGRNRDTAWFAMLDGEWPARKAAFARWLVPENFDSDGRQISSLRTFNGATE